MVKGPLVTRSEIRKRQQEQAQESLKKQRKAEATYKQEEKRSRAFIAKNKRKTSRSQKQEPANEKKHANGMLF